MGGEKWGFPVGIRGPRVKKRRHQLARNAFRLPLPLAGTQSGGAAKKVAAKKVKKYGALATQLGYKFIPFAAETYGKMGEAALQVVRTLGSAAAEESAPRPWHARTFADATVQRLSVALQRGVQEDQLLRAHVRRTRHLFGVNDGGAPGGGAATESVVARAGAAQRAECRCT